MNTLGNENTTRFWREPLLAWVLLAAAFVVVLVPFYDAVSNMVKWWMDVPEFSHGILLPFVASFLIWQKKNELGKTEFSGSYSGVFVSLLGVFTYFVGEMASLYVVVQYGFWLCLVGIAWSYMGTKAMQQTWAAWFILFLMIPLPNFITWNLSAQLQLISSQIGVFVIRLFGISVNLEGNVIDLGQMKLQVVEACSGLRYLFPLMTLGVIVAYFLSAPLWQRVLLFISSIPITVLMNSIRIGGIGVTVEFWGKSMAEGFLHDFEGWIVFMASFAVMLTFLWGMLRFSGDKRALADVFRIELPANLDRNTLRLPRKIPVQLVMTLVIFLLTAAFAGWLPQREEIVPARKSYFDFPTQIGDWQGFSMPLEREYIEALHLTDYVVMNYRQASHQPITFYSAWYDSQRKGRSVHSPKTCLPGGGWVMSSFGQVRLDNVLVNNEPLEVNRAVIEKDGQRQLVYYWFQQRGRDITNEYAVKAYLFWDGLTRNRSDGALVRLIVPVPADLSVETAEADLQQFMRKLTPMLTAYIPN